MIKVCLAILCLCGINLSAEVPGFEKPPANLKKRVVEYYDQDEKDMTVEMLDRKIVEVFNEKGDLVAREFSGVDGKKEKFTYQHVYDKNGEISSRMEINAAGETVKHWRYSKNDAGLLEVLMTMPGDEKKTECLYRFNKRGDLEEHSCSQTTLNKLGKEVVEVTEKVLNKYSPEGKIIEQFEFAYSSTLSRVELVQRSEFKYNEGGQLTRRICFKKNGHLFVEETFNAVGHTESYSIYDRYGDDVVEQTANEYQYDESGKIVEVKWNHGKVANLKFKFQSGHTYYHYEFSK